MVGSSQDSSHWLRVKELSDALPESRERDELGSLACAQLLAVGARIGTSAEAMGELFREGEAFARRSDSTHALARLLSAYGMYRLSTTGRRRGAVGMLEKAVALMEETGDLGGQIACRYNLTIAEVLHDPVAALRLCDEAEERIGVDPRPGLAALGLPPRPLFYWLKSIVLGYTGRFAETERMVEAIRETGGEQFGFASGSASSLAAERGESERALFWAHESLARALALGRIPVLELLAQLRLGEAHLLGQRWDEALEAHERSRALIREHGANLNTEVLSLLGIAQACLGRGDLERATAIADESVALSLSRDQTVVEAQSRTLRARVRTRRLGADQQSASLADLERSSEIVAELGLRALEHEVLEARAELARALGDEATRRRQLRDALHCCMELGASGHARRLEGELTS